MAKRFERALLGSILGVAGVGGAVGSGCVSNNATPITEVDGSIQYMVDGAYVPVDGGTTPIPGDETVAPTPDGATSTPDTSVPDAAPTTASVRFAWFVGAAGLGGTGGTGPEGFEVRPADEDAGDAGPTGYDVCVALHGTGIWTGPLLAKSSLAGGLQPFDVTSYFQVPPGRYDARIVAAGSTTCDLPDAGGAGVGEGGDDAGDGGADAGDAGPVGSGGDAGPSTDFTNLPAVVAGSALSVVLVNPSTPNAIADVFTFADDTKTTAGKAKVRFVNVSESDVLEPVDAGASKGDEDAGTYLQGVGFGFGGGYVYSPLFKNVTSQEGIDPTAANGYVEIDPVTGIDATISFYGQGSDGAYAPTTDSLTLPAGSLLTAFYVPAPGNDSGTALVWCYDGVPSATNVALTKCGIGEDSNPTDSAQSASRFGNFLADTDAGAIDVCVKYHAYGAYVGPLVAQAGTAAGVSADNFSAYFELHGGFSYDVRYVAGGAGDCTQSLSDTTLTSFSGAGGGYTSWILTGFTTVPADAGTIPPYDAGPLLDAAADDDNDAGPPPTTSPLPSLAKTILALEDIPYNAPGVPGIRFVHVDANDPNPLSVTVNGDDVSWAIDDVPYGGISTQPFPVDPYGYVTTQLGTLALDYDVSEASFNMPNEQVSLFAYGPPGAVQLLACDDYSEQFADQSAGVYPCCIVGSENCLTPQAEIVQAQPNARRSHLKKHKHH